MSSDVRAASVSEAWVSAVETIDAMPNDHGFQMAVRILLPTDEVPAVRRIVDGLLEGLNLAPVDEVRNTVFPFEVARRYPEPAELGERYRERLYPRLKKLHSANRTGTYFGRFVDYPTPPGAVDQLAGVVAKLRSARSGKKWKARYEVDMADGLELAVYRHGKDEKKTMAFPCLSFCSFQLDEGRVHMAANYRSQYMVQRAYGNYLGLGQLLGYVAGAAGFDVGELLVVSGHVSIETAVAATRAAASKARRALDSSGTADR